MEAITGLVDSLPSLSSISDAIGDAIGTSLNNTLGRVLYIIVSAISWFFSIIYKFFEVFSGQMKVSYNGEYNFLTNIFFENSTISGIYWGMAIIGVVLCFAFTIISVIKKMFDGADKIQTSMGAILGSMFKSILVILSLNAAMVVVLNFTNVLMQRVIYVFNAGPAMTESQRIDFSEDQFATMGRILNTIGNYSINPSRNSRYNLNSCFNEIRGDLLYLQDQGVFEFYYLTEDENGEEIETWQSELQTLVFAGSLKEELKMDTYNESVGNALLDIMETLETNTNFYPLEYYERAPIPLDNIPLDRILFLACTYNAALNEEFNINPSHTDPLRGPYYNGQKSIYDFDQVVQDFNLVWGFNYVIFFIIIYGIWSEMLYILLDCIARIYNMVLLYLVAPPFIALSPLDGGGKMKQWMTAFVVQCFGVFGTVISMRLLLTFIPIIVSVDLQIFENPVMDILAKVLLVDGGFLVAKKASAMFSGILADSAGWQSITAGSLRADYDSRAREAEAKADKKEGKARQAEQDRKQREHERKQQQEKKGGGGKNLDTAKAGTKIAAGAGDLKDMQQVGTAVSQQQQQSMDKTGLGNVNNNDPTKTPVKTDGGDNTPKTKGGGSKTPEKTNTGGNEKRGGTKGIPVPPDPAKAGLYKAPEANNTGNKQGAPNGNPGQNNGQPVGVGGPNQPVGVGGPNQPVPGVGDAHQDNNLGQDNAQVLGGERDNRIQVQQDAQPVDGVAPNIQLGEDNPQNDNLNQQKQEIPNDQQGQEGLDNEPELKTAPELRHGEDPQSNNDLDQHLNEQKQDVPVDQQNQEGPGNEPELKTAPAPRGVEGPQPNNDFGQHLDQQKQNVPNYQPNSGSAPDIQYGGYDQQNQEVPGVQPELKTAPAPRFAEDPQPNNDFGQHLNEQKQEIPNYQPDVGNAPNMQYGGYDQQNTQPTNVGTQPQYTGNTGTVDSQGNTTTEQGQNATGNDEHLRGAPPKRNEQPNQDK